MKRFITILTALSTAAAAFATNLVFNAGSTNYLIQQETHTNWANVFVGTNAADIVLTVQDDSRIISTNLTIGALDSGASNNTVRLLNSTAWNVASNITVGAVGQNSRLELSGGSAMGGLNAVIGESASASNSSVSVNNATWAISSNLTVGASASGNTLEITNGGKVYANNMWVGSNSANNAVLVESNGVLNVTETLKIGGTGGNVVEVKDAGAVFVSNLNVSAGNEFIIGDGGGLIAQDLAFDSSVMTWEDGGTIQVSDRLSGLGGISGSNRVLNIVGAGWTNGNTVVSGVSNKLYVSTIAQVFSTNDVVIGGAGSEQLYVQAQNSGTVWAVNGNFGVEGGISNQVWITDRAELNSESGTVGGAGSERAFVGLDAAEWNMANGLAVGDNATNSLLQVFNGAQLSSGTGTIGGGSSLSNTVLVTGSGSRWNVASNLTVTGTANQLIAQDYGWVVVGDGETAAWSGAQGGMLIAQSNGTANVTISDGAKITAYPIFANGQVVASGVYVGAGTSSVGRVNIDQGGTLQTYLLGIGEGSEVNLNDGGKLELQSSFNAGTNGFNWNDGGHLQVEYGSLYGMASTNMLNAEQDEETYFMLDGNNKKLSIGNGAVWDTSEGKMAIGMTGGGNTLYVTNGGTVEAVNAYIGYFSSSNSVVVTGTNSLLLADEAVYLGSDTTTNNDIIIENGGRLATRDLFITNSTLTLKKDGYIGIDGDFSVDNYGAKFDWNSGELELSGLLVWEGNLDKTNQTLSLTGEKASWQNRDATNLIVGADGFGNTLNILSGATVSNINATVGANAAAVSNNAVVSGSGSVWVNTGSLTVGHAANSNNTVTVSDNARIVANGLTINGTNSFNLENTGTLEMTGEFDAAQNGFNWESGGTLIAKDTLNNLGLTDGTNRILMVDGGTVVSTNSVLYWGNEGSGNKMQVISNSSVIATSSYIGFSTNASQNSVSISGPNAVWSNASDVVVGYYGSGNSASVSGDAEVYLSNGVIGLKTGADNNTVTLSGTNTKWYAEEKLTVGRQGKNNRLEISGGAQATNRLAVLGAFSDGNTVSVTDDAKWISGEIRIGASIPEYVFTYTNSAGEEAEITIPAYKTKNNAVTVSDGGRVETETLTIVDGNDFNLNSGGTLHIDALSFNITNEQHKGLNWNSGGNLSLTGELIGAPTNNLVVGKGVTNTFGYLDGGKILTLSTTNGVWNNDNLILGNGSGSTKLVLEDGGSVNQTDTFIGWKSSDNEMLVKSNSTATSSGDFYLGQYKDSAGNLQYSGTGNMLTVSNGGWVLIGDAANTNGLSGSGIFVADSSNAVLSVKYGSSVLAEDSLWVGFGSSTGTVTAADGGSVTVGKLAVADGSALNINAYGRLKVNGDYDYLAQSNVNWNAGGTLAVGGELTNLSGMLQTNRYLSMEGTNAVWGLGNNTLIIGESGSGNLLYILDGATVTNGNAVVGKNPGANRNQVFVYGGNSLWDVNGQLQVGSVNGIGNQVTVANNGTVSVNSLYVHDRNAFNLNDGGNLRITDDFNFSSTSVTGLNWNTGGNLILEGALTGGMPSTNYVTTTNAPDTFAYLNGGRVLTLDGGSWINNGETNLIVGFESANNKLVITNGAAVANRDGYIGWGKAGKNNSVLVSDAGSVWTNRGSLYLGLYRITNDVLAASGSGNSLTVSNGAYVLVGPGATNAPAGGGLFVAGAEIAAGNGSVVDAENIYVGDTALFAVSNGAVVKTGNLVINNSGDFNLAGTLEVTDSSLNAGQTGFNWLDNGAVVMNNSDLFGVSTITGQNKKVTINVGSWSNSAPLFISGTNHVIAVNSSSNSLMGVLTSAGAAIGTSATDRGIQFTLSGSNTVWANSGDLYVGNATMKFENGADVTNNSAFLGVNASGKTYTVSGSGTVWQVNGGLAVGGATGSNNIFTVENQAEVHVADSVELLNGTAFNLSTNTTFTVGKDLTLNESQLFGDGTVYFPTGAVDNTLSIIGPNAAVGSAIRFEPGGGHDTVYVSNSTFTVSDASRTQYAPFDELEMKDALLTGSDKLNMFDQITVSGGRIDPNGTLRVYGQFSATDGAILDVTLGNDQLKLMNQTNAFNLSGMGVDVTILPTNQSLVNYTNEFLVSAQDGGFSGDFVSTNFYEDFLLFEFSLITNNSAVAVVSKLEPSGKLSSTLPWAQTESVRAGFGNMQNAVFTRTKQLRRNLVATKHAIPHEAYLLSNTNAPVGAEGPGDENTIFDMHLWFQGFGGQGDYNGQGNTAGFKLNQSGTTFGADRLFGDSLTMGLNYTYALAGADSENGDRLDTESYWLGMYGEWVSKNGLYVDTLLAAGWSNFDSFRNGGAGYQGVGSYSGSQYGMYADVGQYYHYKNLALSPYAGLHFLSARSEAFNEVSGPISIHVDSSDRQWFESALGMKFRHRFDTRWGRFQTTGYGEWLHDFENDDVYSQVSGNGSQSISTHRVSPDPDVLGAGLGFSWMTTDYLEVGIGYNGTFSENYEEHTGSILFDVRF